MTRQEILKLLDHHKISDGLVREMVFRGNFSMVSTAIRTAIKHRQDQIKTLQQLLGDINGRLHDYSVTTYSTCSDTGAEAAPGAVSPGAEDSKD
jgi:hypothetical protein